MALGSTLLLAEVFFFYIVYLYDGMYMIEIDQVQVQGFCLTQHCLNTCLVFYSITATCSSSGCYM
jgi:hypothetical protein